jgi:hypothetical protein
MQDNPTVAEIMEEVRQGLADTAISDATQVQAHQLASIQDTLRQAHAHASVLGRCGGSLRGRVCRMAAPLARPIIEQIDLFHAAIVRCLETTASQSAETSETKKRLAALEHRLAQIESQEQPQGPA